MDIKSLEERLLKILGKNKRKSVKDLVGEIGIYELFHIPVFENEFTKIKVVNLDLNERQSFEDGKYYVQTPYFEIERKEE